MELSILEGRLTLINLVLTILLSYFMSIFKLPKWMIKKINQLKRAILWKGKEKVSGFHYLANWDSICRSMEQGGLGVKNFKIMDITLLSK